MRYNTIKPNDVVNGTGVAVSLFTQGCPHHCKGCFNENTWSFKDGKEWTEDLNEYILGLLDKNNVHRNLSILGGEPLCKENIEGVLKLCAYIKHHRPDTKIFVWSGYTFEELIIMYDYSLFKFDILIDGQFKEELKDYTLKLRGSSNQRVIDVKQAIKNIKLQGE